MQKSLCVMIYIFISLFSPLIYAVNIYIDNKTNDYGTGKFHYSPCSADFGSRGIAKPNESLEVPSAALKVYCNITNCTAHIFISDNCANNTEIATAILSHSRGIISYENKMPDKFLITKQDATHATITSVNHGVINWVKRFWE